MKHFLYEWHCNIPCARAYELPTCKIKICALCILLHNSVLLYEFYKTLEDECHKNECNILFFLLW
jgi:hypothetical protein